MIFFEKMIINYKTKNLQVLLRISYLIYFYFQFKYQILLIKYSTSHEKTNKLAKIKLLFISFT